MRPTLSSSSSSPSSSNPSWIREFVKSVVESKSSKLWLCCAESSPSQSNPIPTTSSPVYFSSYTFDQSESFRHHPPQQQQQDALRQHLQQQHKQKHYPYVGGVGGTTITKGGAMGTTTSAYQTKPTQEQADIQHLGNRFPFGDDELWRLYRAYHVINRPRSGGSGGAGAGGTSDRISFLSDWATQCCLPSSTARQMTAEQVGSLRKRRRDVFSVVESRILSSGWGNSLEKVAFVVHVSDAPDYDAARARTPAMSTATSALSSSSSLPLEPEGAFFPSSSMSMTGGATPAPDERRAKLEAFFEGASNVGRRGGRPALKVLHRCCVDLDRDGVDVAPASELVMAAYQLALACRWLSLEAEAIAAAAAAAAATEEPSSSPYPPSLFPASATGTHSLPCFEEEEKNDRQHEEALAALSQSMIDFARKQKLLDSDFGTLKPEDEALLNAGLMDYLDFCQWAEAICPVMASALSTLMHHVFFPDRPYPPSRTPFDYPSLPQESQFFHSRYAGAASRSSRNKEKDAADGLPEQTMPLSTKASPLLFSLASMSKSLGGTWHRLYTSASDGLSFNRLQNALLGYGGPTLVVIQPVCDHSNSLFGAFTASPWKESKDFYGNSDCFLFQLLPTMAVYRPSPSGGSNYMYCNSEARSRGYDGQAHGIGFGGSTDRPRLFIDESFDNCVASAQDLTFEGGPLLPPTAEGNPQRYFTISALEVWGVGGSAVVNEALGARTAQREITAANLRKARHVDKAAFLDDFRSGLIDSKAFKYRDQISGRADADVEDRHNEQRQQQM